MFGGIPAEQLPDGFGFLWHRMDAAGMFRIVGLMPVPLRPFPAGAVAEGDATEVATLEGPLADSFLDMGAQGVAKELRKAR